jgi:hypothetical protein
LASSSVAAPIIATICSADSRYTGRLRFALSLRLRVFTRTRLRGIALLGDGQDLPGAGDGLVDRLRGQDLLADLEGAAAS